MFRLPHQRKAQIQLLITAGFLIAFTFGVKTVANYLDWMAEAVDLRDAIVRGDLEAVKQFERDGVDWRDLTKSDDGYSALHRAIRNGHFGLVRYFAENGADVAAEAAGGVTPAGVAVNFMRLDILKFLLMETPDGEAIARNDLSLATIGRYADLDLLKWLATRTDLEMFITLSEGDAFMLKAARFQDADMVARLLALKVPAGPNPDDWREGYYGEVTIPKSSGGDLVEIVSGQNYTPLHWAAINGNIEIAKLLLDHGADPAIADADGKTPLDHAIEKGFDQIAELIGFSTKTGPGETE